MIKVVKFGGSSLADGKSFAKVKDIILSDSARSVVVVSAPGKRYKDDMKVTDLLYLCRAHIKYNAPYDDIFSQIEERYREIYRACGLNQDLEGEFIKIRSQLNKQTTSDFIASRGEYLNAKLMAEYLGYTFVDSADWLKFNYNGKVDFALSYENLSKIIEQTPKVVLPGFYGATPDGNIKVFSRGGSDITGAIAAAAIDAGTYENWTDVSGIMSADPRIVENPRPIENVTYAELRELSHMGAEVLHEDTVFPVRQKNIPLYIKNTNDKNGRGTLIMESFDENDDRQTHFITGISGKSNYTIITISKSGMSEENGYIKNTLEIVERYEAPVEHILCSVDTFSLVIPYENVKKCLHEIIARISDELKPDNVKIANNISIIALVGRKLYANVGIAGKIFSALGKNDINIRMIEQGADEINIMVGIEDKDFKKAIQVIYNLSEVEQ